LVGNFNTICTGTIIGENCTIFHNCSIGEIPQDLKYKGEQTGTTIGSDVIVRENVTINRGTSAYGTTKIGNNVLLMAAAHVAHDCIISDNVIMANMATLGGHVEIKEYASLGGGVLVHQFCRIGSNVFIGGGFRVVQDVPPFILAVGEPLHYGGINSIGLKRRGFTTEALTNIKKAYRKYFRSDLPRSSALEKMKNEMATSAEIEEIINFIDTSERGII
jgi:UDP-N-acetylglucosamine acyltransferase